MNLSLRFLSSMSTAPDFSHEALRRRRISKIAEIAQSLERNSLRARGFEDRDAGHIFFPEKCFALPDLFKRRSWMCDSDYESHPSTDPDKLCKSVRFYREGMHAS